VTEMEFFLSPVPPQGGLGRIDSHLRLGVGEMTEVLPGALGGDDSHRALGGGA
jgi:hypothetical protein